MPIDQEQSDVWWQQYFSAPFRWSAEPAERSRMVAFVGEHERTCPPPRGVVSCKYEIRLVPTGIGVLVSIHCLVCNDTKDVTDVDKF